MIATINMITMISMINMIAGGHMVISPPDLSNSVAEL